MKKWTDEQWEYFWRGVSQGALLALPIAIFIFAVLVKKYWSAP